jgi:predicted phosphodiesterase
MAPALRWTLDRLPGEAVDELTGLGKAGTLEMEGFVIEVEHASPGSDWVGIQPGTSTAKLEEMLAGLECHVFVCGHTHKAIIRNAERMLVVNVGSVGYPYDTIKRPSWALLSSSPERIEAVIHRVDYDRDAVVKDIAEVGMAMGDVMTRRLETAEM